MVRVAIEFSGEHPGLPRAEAEAVFRSLGIRHRLLSSGTHSIYEVEGEVPWDLLARRLAYSRRVMEVEASGSLRDLERAASEIGVEGRTFAIRGPREALPALGPVLKGRGLRVSLDAPDTTLRIFGQGGSLHLARERAVVDRSAYGARRPALRPFFKPGVVLPRLARALANLAETPPGGTLLDPFCGTGSLLVEGSLCGLRALGADAQLTMVVGTRRNLRALGLPAEVAWGDARRLPFRDGSVGGIATDPPYGRSAKVVGEARGDLYRKALAETARVLRPGGRAVFLSAENRLPEVPGLVEEEHHRVFVHKSLVRHVAVLRKLSPGGGRGLCPPPPPVHRPALPHPRKTGRGDDRFSPSSLPRVSWPMSASSWSPAPPPASARPPPASSPARGSGSSGRAGRRPRGKPAASGCCPSM